MSIYYPINNINSFKHFFPVAFMDEEIERKFLVRNLPENLDQYPHSEIIQGYMLSCDPGFMEERLRKEEDKYTLTIKLGKGSVRPGGDIKIPKEHFERLWPKTGHTFLEKIRYKIPFNGLTIELDIFCGKLEQIVTAEVEFKSREERDSFVPPSWFAEEVTNDARYSNKNLALYGFPRDYWTI